MNLSFECAVDGEYATLHVSEHYSATYDGPVLAIDGKEGGSSASVWLSPAQALRLGAEVTRWANEQYGTPVVSEDEQADSTFMTPVDVRAEALRKAKEILGTGLFGAVNSSNLIAVADYIVNGLVYAVGDDE